MVEGLLRPFLTGVFLEPDLATSRRFLDLVLRTFVRASPCLPALGMQEIPRQLASGLPANVVQLDSPAVAVSATAVTTKEATVKARAVVVATDPTTAARLLPALTQPRMNSVTTWYHSTDDLALADGRPILHLDNERRGPVVNSVVVSHAAPAYAPQGRVLVSSSTLGTQVDADTERRVLDQLARMYGRSTKGWDMVAVYPIPHALPSMLPPHDFRRPVRLDDGLYLAGDHRDSSSIQGAMVSGRRTAQSVIADLGASR